jgi:hypothetical protein
MQSSSLMGSIDNTNLIPTSDRTSATNQERIEEFRNRLMNRDS